MRVTPVTSEWIDKIDAIDEDMELRIHCAINRDDKELVISLMRSPDFLKSNRFAHEDELWQSICTADAVNCATSLLEGELGRWARAGDVNTPILGFGGRGAKILPLHYAAHYACPGVINVILNRGARTDIRLYDPQNILGAGGLLPLEIALDFVRDFLSEWIVFSPGESTFFQLIASLCHPRMKFLLEACKLLALSSQNVAKEAYYYATKGKLTEFAVLLMVAREKVLAPITFSRQDGDGRNGSMTLHQYLVNEIGSLFDKEWKLPGSLVKKKLTSIHGKKMVLSSAALLVEVFEKAGKAIEEYVQLERGSEEDEQVEKDVALRLGEVGFTLKNGDFDFSIKNWMSSRNSVRTPIKPLETSSEGLSQLVHHPLSLLQQRNYHPRIGIIPGGGYLYSSPTYPVRRTPILFSVKNSYYSPSWDVQVNKQMKTIELGLPKFLSREKLAYISMLIRKGIRSA